MLKIRRFLEYKKCACCEKEYLSYQLEKINSNNDYICPECEYVHRYSEKNISYRGKQTQTSFSIEFETSSRNKELYELAKYKFIPCSDSSIEGYEWKSQIFYNKKTFFTICRKIEKFAMYVGESCGTHLHVGTEYKCKIDEYKRELFQPILDIMNFDVDTTIKFWGRDFNSYCLGYIRDSSRYNSFNTISSVNTLEFRLLKYRSAEQYIRACNFCIDTTRYINHFIGREDFNREKAIKIGNNIANKYEEVIQNV